MYKQVDTLLDDLFFEDNEKDTSSFIYDKQIENYSNKQITYVFTIDDKQFIKNMTHISQDKIYIMQSSSKYYELVKSCGFIFTISYCVKYDEQDEQEEEEKKYGFFNDDTNLDIIDQLETHSVGNNNYHINANNTHINLINNDNDNDNDFI